MAALTALEIIEIRQMNGIMRYGITIEIYRDLQRQTSERINKAMLANMGLAPDSPAAIELMKGISEKFGLVKPCTPLQDVSGAYMLEAFLGRVIKTAKQAGHWSLEKPIIASEAGGDVNGFCFRDEYGTNAIVLDEHLFTYANLFCKIIIAAMAKRESGENDNQPFLLMEPDHFEENLRAPACFQRLSELLVAFVENGTPAAAPQYFAPHDLNGYLSQLRDGVEEFIVAHECGHLQLGHLDDPLIMEDNSIENLTKMIDKNTPNFIYRHAKEFEADAFAFAMTLQSIDLEKGDSILRAGGPFLFFIGLEMLENCLYYYVTGKSIYDKVDTAMGRMLSSTFIPSTHPPAFARCMRLLKSAQEAELPEPLARVCTFFGEEISPVLMDVEAQLIEIFKKRGGRRRIHNRWHQYTERFSVMDAIGADMLRRLNDTSKKD